jgi:nitrite reductase (NADH) small subunit/3-phenylpropionate/trans-cinnamate dioxygenase ferredoxin subunit
MNSLRQIAHMKNKDTANFHTVCRVSEIPDREGRMFAVAGTTIGVFNIGGSFYALANECPHAGASLAHGIVESETVRCRIHHWRFSIRDGTYLDEDKPQCNVPSFPVRIVGDEIQIEVVTDA